MGRPLASKTLVLLLSLCLACAPIRPVSTSYLADLPPPKEVQLDTSACEELRQQFAGDLVATSSTSYFEEFLVWKCRAEESAVWWYFWQGQYNRAADVLVLAETERKAFEDAPGLPDWIWPVAGAAVLAVFIGGVLVGLETASNFGQK